MGYRCNKETFKSVLCWQWKLGMPLWLAGLSVMKQPPHSKCSAVTWLLELLLALLGGFAGFPGGFCALHCIWISSVELDGICHWLQLAQAATEVLAFRKRLDVCLQLRSLTVSGHKLWSRERNLLFTGLVLTRGIIAYGDKFSHFEERIMWIIIINSNTYKVVAHLSASGMLPTLSKSVLEK